MLKTMNIQHLCTSVVTNMYVFMRIFVAEMICFFEDTNFLCCIVGVMEKIYYLCT